MKPDFATELTTLINRHSKENGSNTPDFILAKYLEGCLHLWNSAVTERGSRLEQSVAYWKAETDKAWEAAHRWRDEAKAGAAKS